MRYDYYVVYSYSTGKGNLYYKSKIPMNTFENVMKMSNDIMKTIKRDDVIIENFILLQKCKEQRI